MDSKVREDYVIVVFRGGYKNPKEIGRSKVITVLDKDAPGHVPTQMLRYLEGFYGYLWENWAKSTEKSLGNNLEIVNNGLKEMFNFSEESDIYQQIIKNLDGYEIPGPNPSPTSFQPAESRPNQNVGVV